MDEVAKQVEALLFACGRKISVEELQVLLGTSSQQVVVDALNELKQSYAQKNSALMIFDEGELWKFTTKEPYLPLVRKINPNTELSKSMMETLAVVAWKQPILQSEVIHIRTNKAYEHVSELEKMQFLIKERYGRTYLLKLTQKFYDYFDLEGEQQARELFSEFKDIVLPQTKMGDFEGEEGVVDGEVVSSDGASALNVGGDALESTADDSLDSAKVVESVEDSDVIAEQEVNDNKTNEGEKMADEEYVNPKKEDRDLKEASGEEEETVYSSSDRETLVDKDEITPTEAAFMEGYNQAEEKTEKEKKSKEEESSEE